MDISQKKERFSTAFVKAVAAQSGFRIAVPDVDDDSVDLIIKGKGYKAPIRNPQLEVQLKCTSSYIETDDIIKFQLSLKNYNDLRGDDLISPRYLFVHVVPEDCEEWLVQDNAFAKLSYKCYWVSIMDSPQTSNTTSVTIDIPKLQVLTGASIKGLMIQASSWGSS